jgi:large subunit ribosomal protein L24
MKLKKGDTVRVITGKDKGKEGVVQRVLPADNKVIVSGVNIASKHQRARRANEQAGIIDKDMPIPLSSVAIVSPGDGKPTRVGYRFDDNGNKIRICKRTKVDL